jgi:hypothetical protein
VGEEWCVRTLPIPSTILNTAFSVYAENLPFSINLSKCTTFATDADDNDYCTRWARINTETKNLTILPSVAGSYEDIEVDLGSVQDELSNLYNKMNTVYGDYLDDNGEIAGKVDKVAGSSLVTDEEISHLGALDTQTELDTKIDLKADKDLSNDTDYVPLLGADADGLEVVYVDDTTNGTQRMMSLAEVKEYSLLDITIEENEIWEE